MIGRMRSSPGRSAGRYITRLKRRQVVAGAFVLGVRPRELWRRFAIAASFNLKSRSAMRKAVGTGRKPFSSSPMAT